MFSWGPLHYNKKATAIAVFITCNDQPNGHAFVYYFGKRNEYEKKTSGSEQLTKDKFVNEGFYLKRLKDYKQYYYNTLKQ